MRFYFPIDKENRIACELFNGQWATIWTQRLYGLGWGSRNELSYIDLPMDKLQEFSRFLERIDKLRVLE